jgi:uncharacterized protein with GYD domain
VVELPTYVILTRLTSEGLETVKEKPERILEVNRELEAMGVKVLSQYLLLGPYDFVNIVEAPDNETVAKAAITLGARGTVETTTMPAIPVEALIRKLKA